MVVELDIRILVLFCAIAVLIQGALSLLFASSHSAGRAIRPIGFSSIVMSGAFALMSLEQRVPNFVAIVLAQCLAQIAFLLLDRGARLFQGESTRDPLGWTTIAVSTAALGAATAATDDLRFRIIIGSLAVLVLVSRLALRLRRGVQRGGTPAHRTTERIFWIFAGTMVLRITVAAISPPQPASESPNLIQSVSLPLALVLLSASTLGFWSMEVQRLYNELLKLATTDETTGILNRRAFLSQCERLLARHLVSNEPLSLVLLDLDDFKRVNDTYGHPAGDDVLRAAVLAFQTSIRPGDVVGRIGGEEFALLLPGVGPGAAWEIADRARAALGTAPFSIGGRLIPVTTSAGVASAPVHGRDLPALIHAADAALYAAKAAGRNRVHVAPEPERARPMDAPDALAGAAAGVPLRSASWEATP